MLKVNIQLINEHGAQLTWSNFEKCLVPFKLTLDTLDDNYHFDAHTYIIKANESSSIIDDNLMPGYWNNLHIKPLKTGCQYDRSQVPWHFATKPLPPEKLKCESNSSKTIHLSWENPEASNYFSEHHIRVRDDNGYLVHQENFSKFFTSWKYEKAVPEQLYEITLYASSINDNPYRTPTEGYIIQSDPVQCSFRTKPMPPMPPSGADVMPNEFQNTISPWHFMVILGVAASIALGR